MIAPTPTKCQIFPMTNFRWIPKYYRGEWKTFLKEGKTLNIRWGYWLWQFTYPGDLT